MAAKTTEKTEKPKKTADAAKTRRLTQKMLEPLATPELRLLCVRVLELGTGESFRYTEAQRKAYFLDRADMFMAADLNKVDWQNLREPATKYVKALQAYLQGGPVPLFDGVYVELEEVAPLVTFKDAELWEKGDEDGDGKGPKEEGDVDDDDADATTSPDNMSGPDDMDAASDLDAQPVHEKPAEPGRKRAPISRATTAAAVAPAVVAEPESTPVVPETVPAADPAPRVRALRQPAVVADVPAAAAPAVTEVVAEVKPPQRAFRTGGLGQSAVATEAAKETAPPAMRGPSMQDLMAALNEMALHVGKTLVSVTKLEERLDAFGARLATHDGELFTSIDDIRATLDGQSAAIALLEKGALCVINNAVLAPGTEHYTALSELE